MGLFRRKKEVAIDPEEKMWAKEEHKSRLERLREWREARAGRRFEKRKRKFEREAELAEREIPLEERRTRLAELRARTARAQARARVGGGGRGSAIFGGAGVMKKLGGVGERASQAQAMIFGETGREFGQARRAGRAAPANIFGAPRDVGYAKTPTRKRSRRKARKRSRTARAERTPFSTIFGR